MSGSSGKSNELESRNSSKTQAGRKNLVADNSGQNYTVPVKNQPKKLSSSVRIESENLSNYRDIKAKREDSGTRDYAKNLETIRNKLKLLDITQRSSSVSSRNDVQDQCPSSSPKTSELHTSASSSIKKVFPNTTCTKEKKTDGDMAFSNSLSSCNSSPKNEKPIQRKQVSGGSSSRSAKIINICSPRKKMYFTSSSISNSSSNGGFNSYRQVVNEKSKQLFQHPKKKATSSGSTSGSSRKKPFEEVLKPKRRTRKTIKKKDASIIEVLNKVCRPKWEYPSKQSKNVISNRVSISASTTDEEIDKPVSDSQGAVPPLKITRESPESSSRINTVENSVSRELSSQKCKMSNKKPENRPITRRSEQGSPFKGTSKSLPIKSTESEPRSKLPKMSQSALFKGETLKTRSHSIVKLSSPTKAKKHPKAKVKSDSGTKLPTRKSNSSNYALPELRKMKTDSYVAAKSASFRKIKKSDDSIQSKHKKPKILEKTEDLTLTAMLCSPKDEVSPAEIKSAASPPQLTSTSSTITDQKPVKTVPYKFPFPSTTIPRAFTLEGLSCDTTKNTPKKSKPKKKSGKSPPSPRSNASDLRVYSIHLDLPNVFDSDKRGRSGYLIPHLKKKRRNMNPVRARTGDSSNSRRGFSNTRSLQFTISPKKLVLTQRSKSLPEKGKSILSGRSQKNIETMFWNVTYSDPSTSQSETYFSETLSCPIPSKRICMRDDPDYDIFQIIIENDDNSSIASTCTSPPKKKCVRDKTPEMSQEFKRDYSDPSGTPSEKDSVESVPSDDFKNSILSMLLEWREKEEEKINVEQESKDKSTITWVNQTSTNKLCPTESFILESISKEAIITSEKYKTEPFPSPEPQDDIDLSVDFDEEGFGQQLAVISEETRVFSEEDVNLKSINSTGRLSLDEDLMLKLPLEPEVTVVGSLQTSSSRRSCDGQNHSMREKQDATTSVQDLRLPMENKETSTCNDLFLKDVEQHELELCDKGVTASEALVETLDQKVETCDKSSWVCSCFLMPLLKRSVFEAYQVPYGEGDPIISLLELKDDTAMKMNQLKITPKVDLVEVNKEEDQDNVTHISDIEDHSDGVDNAIIPLNSKFMVSLDVPKKFLCLYDFPGITKITTIAGNCESCVSIWEKNDTVLTEPIGSRLSSPKSRLSSSRRKPKDVTWKEDVAPEMKLPKLADDVDRNLFTVLYRSRSCAAYSPNKSTFSICRCQSERGFLETSESEDEDEDEKQCGCFNCFRRLFGGRRKKFFDSHS